MTFFAKKFSHLRVIEKIFNLPGLSLLSPFFDSNRYYQVPGSIYQVV